MDTLSERLRDRKSFRQTLETLSTLYQSDFYEPSWTGISKLESMQMPSLGANQQRKQALQLFSESPALESFPRRLGISSEAVFGAHEEEGGTHILHEKQKQMLGHWKNMSISADSPLVAQLTPMDSVSQLLSCALNEDSPFGWSLSNTEQEDKFAALEKQLGLSRRASRVLT